MINRNRIAATTGIALSLAMIIALAFSRYAVSQGMGDEWRDTPPAVVAGLIIVWFVLSRRRERLKRHKAE